jgi:hypothetical protein
MRSYLQLLFLVVPVLSAVINQAYLGCDTDDFHPAWEIENRLTIVPLNKTARTGVLPEAVEEGLIAAGKLAHSPGGPLRLTLVTDLVASGTKVC